ncbi:hypothetical protein B0O80DRAFT_499052 [Mortierella sp. GBAus27b]|nr:18S rRNA maturation protein [Mortierella sp. GBA43]KAI8352962.1 hypothetical protein B0O80DRAFT_499052 [Mortierella sp. GBAus27b]
MPATHKRIVNPEKELRGKKPYKRDFTKKTYQAKPKRLDAGEVPDGSAALKKKLRDTLRMLGTNTRMPADLRLEHERRVDALKLQIAEKKVDQTEQKMSTKYRMLRFFESKKAERKIKIFMKQHVDWESKPDEKKELESLKLDLAYIHHFPKTQKYISLYPNENADDPVVSQARNEIREKIRFGLETGEVTQFVKATREEVKSKVLSYDKLTTEETIKQTAQKINNSKKRALQDDQNPLAARARATAARDANKPTQASIVEEETFFEMIPKVVAASDLVKAKEPVKKKAKNEKQLENQEIASTKQLKQEHSKVDQQKKDQAQPKKEQLKKERSQKVVQKETEVTHTNGTHATATGDSKKLGKWAKLAIRNQQAAAAAAKQPASESDNSSDSSAKSSDDEEESSSVTPAATEMNIAGSNTNSDSSQSSAESSDDDEMDSSVASAAVTKLAIVEASDSSDSSSESSDEDGEMDASLPATAASGSGAKSSDSSTESSDEDEAESTKTDAPRITTLKISHDDSSDSDDSDDSQDEPVAPVRKIVKVDTSLLKELPEVPKRRGGRNQNKFRK